MLNELDKKAQEQIIKIGVAIAALRNIKRMSQEELAEKVGISSVEVSLIESANVYKSFSMEIFYNIAKALEVEPAKLIKGEISL